MRESDEKTGGIATRQCANCGTDIGTANFCSNCGHPAFAEAPTEKAAPFPRHQAAAEDAAASVDTGVIPPVRGTDAAERLAETTDPHGAPIFSGQPGPAQPAYPPRPSNRARVALIAGGVVALLAAIGVVLALTVFSSSNDSTSAYQQKVANVLAPVVDANRNLSSALGGLHGTRATAAKRATSAAQQATSSAQGALGALSTPSDSRRVASEARQALDRESTYLTAVSNALAHPSSPGVSQLQTLAGNVTSAFDAIDAPLSGAGQSVSGADTLTTWAHRISHSSGRQSASSSGGSGTSTPGPYAGQRYCGGGVHAGPNTSCDFAQNVFDAYYAAPGSSATVEVYSPVTGQTYTMSCSPAGSGVTCSGGNGASVSW